MNATPAPRFVLRPGERGDADAIATVWYTGWRESHLGHIPDALLAHRGPSHFRERVPAILSATTVATVGGDVAGLLVTTGDEIEQLYVTGRCRGTGMAAALLHHGETVIGAGFPTAFPCRRRRPTPAPATSTNAKSGTTPATTQRRNMRLHQSLLDADLCGRTPWR